MISAKAVVCHISIMHDPFDVRIYHKECRALVEDGYEVHLVVPHSRNEVVGGVHIHALPPSSSRLAKIFVYPWLAYRKVLSLRPRPVVCHFSDPGTLPAGMALRLKGFKVIYDVRENVADQILSKEYIPAVLRKPMTWIYRFIEGITSSGMATVHVLDSIARRYRLPRVTVRNLPKLNVKPVSVERAGHDRSRLIYIGGVNRLRGALTMIELAGELRRRGMDFQMRIIGPWEEDGIEQDVKKAIADARLSEQVVATGPVPYEQALAEVAAADIGLCLLHPVPNYLNSIATKILEYMQYELPVVASNFECWQEFVTDVGSGIQVDPLSIPEIADAIQWLLDRPDQMRRMGERGRQAIERQYCWEKEKQKLLDFYAYLLGRG
jgi:glycosyltransferase involved in cell wall biosynthesis